MYMHFKQTHLYAIRSTMRYITHSKYRNWSKCDVRRILNCDIYRIYFLNAMYVASACGVLLSQLLGATEAKTRMADIIVDRMAAS